MSIFSWMAWTTPTALFFVAVFGMLAFMTVLSSKSPSVARKGLLPIATTRGDRLYIGLISTAFIFIFWFALSDASPLGASAISAVWLASILRWG